MHFEGFLVGLSAFLIIGLFHPVVIKCEYYFTDRIWRAFLPAGCVFLGISLFSDGVVSSVFSVLGFTCLWSIGELKEQRARVEKGWFPANPNRASQARKSKASRLPSADRIKDEI